MKRERITGTDTHPERTYTCGGLRGEHVPWLSRAGVRQFHVGSTARPGGSWTKSYVDAAHVRSWRMLLDDAVEHADALRRAHGSAG